MIRDERNNEYMMIIKILIKNLNSIMEIDKIMMIRILFSINIIYDNLKLITYYIM
jgi:hypothetical protein